MPKKREKPQGTLLKSTQASGRLKSNESDESPLPPPLPRSYGSVYWWLIAPLLSILLPVLVGLVGTAHHQSIYASYHPTLCTILDKQIDTTTQGGAHSPRYFVYTPDMIFAASLPDGNHQVFTGYGGPDQESFLSVEQAQDVLNRYRVGATSRCWFSTYDGNVHVVLVLHYDVTADIPRWLLTLAFGIPLLLGEAFFGYFAYRPRVLVKRGIETQGYVWKRNLARRVALVEFWTLTTPALRYEIVKQAGDKKAFPRGQHVNVVYDRRNPDHAVVGSLQEVAELAQSNWQAIYPLLILVLLVLVGVFCLVWWFDI